MLDLPLSLSRADDAAVTDAARWRQVAALYPAPPDAIVNLEHGYFGAMAAPVHAASAPGRADPCRC
ncbi:hypothetical protein [Janthinobacterium sp. LB2P10]|uniref:hypothetical protein n=1 Tax=Janthinobacterium sp. LB2P10 TaxID=3424194 RepID=UPI003F28EC07